MRNVHSSQWPSAHCWWRPGIGGTACFASVIRDFKNRLYGTCEALFLIWQAYLMSAMITPEFAAFATDVLCVPFLVTFTMAMCALVLAFLVLACVTWCKHPLFFDELVNPVLGDAGEWVSPVFKDQVYGALKLFSRSTSRKISWH